MINPYQSRSPVGDSALLFGRWHELREAAAFIGAAQSVALVGPPRIGKSSLLLELMRPPAWAGLGLGDANLFVYVDCEALGEAEPGAIFGRLAGEIALALGARGLPPEPALEQAALRPARMALEAALRKLGQRGLRVVLALDGFERLAANGRLDVSFFNALRSVATRYQVVFLSASARPLIELTFSGSAEEILSSPFFNIFASIFLGCLEGPEARRLIREPAERAGSPFAPADVERLYALAGGHPFALQVACRHAFALGGHSAEAERRALSELHLHFEQIWEALTPAEREALRDIDSLAARAAGDATLRGLLRDLVQGCLLVAQGQGYGYPSRAWAEFVAARPADSP